MVTQMLIWYPRESFKMVAMALIEQKTADVKLNYNLMKIYRSTMEVRISNNEIFIQWID